MNHAKELAEALEGLVRINEQHNEEISKIIGRPIGWKDDYLNKARDTLARYRAAVADDAHPLASIWLNDHFDVVPGFGWILDNSLSIMISRSGYILKLRTATIIEHIGDAVTVGILKTRADARSVCNAFGITLKEAGA